MSTVGYIVRDMAGTKQHGTSADTPQATIATATAKDISLNLGPSDVESYARRGQDLHITLIDGQVVVLDDFFNTGATGNKNLFLSEEGNFVEVVLEDRTDGMLYASYEPLDLSGKWSAYDDMVFLDVERIEPVVAPLVAPLLGGLGTAGAAAGVVGAAAIVGGGGGGGGGGGAVTPTVDNPDATYPVAGSTTEDVVVSGTGAPGSTVEVTLGTITETVTVKDDGTWVANFPVTNLPPDGSYETTVYVKDPDGTEFNLDGPSVIIDTTPPPIAVNTVEGDDHINYIEVADGVVINGTGEAGASVSVEFQGVTRTTRVADDGTWSVNYSVNEVATGIYSSTIEVTSADSFGNTSTTTHTVDVDTETRVTINTQVGNDHMISGAEQAAGITLTGTAEAGSSVVVTFQGVSRTVTADAQGNWSASYLSSEIATGTYDASVSAVATDTSGNTSSTSTSIPVDTETTASLDAVQAGDNVISAPEATSGVTLTGKAEAGASVAVTLEGTTHTVTADAQGNWSADFASSEIPTGEYDANVSVTATDALGNTASTTGTVRVDTETEVALSNPLAGDNLINAVEANNGLDLTGTAEAGASVVVQLGNATRTVRANAQGQWTASFAGSDIADGTYDTTVTATATDAYGNTASASSQIHVDTTTSVGLDNGQAGGDDVLNGAEAAGGLTLTGTAEAGASVAVTFQGITRTVTADAQGRWSAPYTTGEITPGEYDAPISVTATDAAGNSESTTGTLRVDTSTAVSIDANQAGGDNIVNAAEAQAGVTLTGAAEPGSAVEVTVAGVTRTATVAANGTWSALFEPGALAAGEYNTSVTVSATDAAGNTASASSALRVDTVAGTVALSPDPIEIDDVINAVERADGVEISGTATPGLTVTVGLGAASRQVVADVNGDWATTFPATEIPTGTQSLPITASIIDDAGNTASVSDTVALDTEVVPLTVQPNQTSDDIVNKAEQIAGTTLSGTVEAGSTVAVTIGAVTNNATVDASGNWSVTFADADLPDGTYTATATIRATDAAGNERSTVEQFSVDTEVGAATINTVTESSNGIVRLETLDATDNYSVNTLNPNGTMGSPAASKTVDPIDGTEFRFGSAIPDGTHLVLSRNDAVGNTSSTLVVFDDNATNAGSLDHAALGQFNVDDLNLHYASDVSLTLNESDIKALSGNSDTLTIRGDNNDTITLAGGNAGGTRQIDGETFNVYTIGNDGTTLIVDQDVQVVL
ncbi:Bacterial Ig-like domain protein (group 3)/Putative flagellar system-associated repeat protein [Phaeobacter inhibens]|uniref:Bacterial Ig-like domain protein (Group 3)/Putative flagellar system-associated repeat protein n=1 Tax=Phaeobacter inhibens TaxID=221822 RepID=A0ABM6RHG7_9RHOB|nr:Ig-like domain-containing protein [Phaeobacter inhibens]AUQ51366.1 Bacterial Ig-like domain protein (group 3)/Putative flagellar system-associated repeat protein [Phaeobacter inhibens]AUQ95885.1 Bacterial Ig-like domain protein (group 3)/Putative flagellar system-associated repeat protein [Phaeobacter inhibens]AUR21171.1 Bacterial Ig-like domain protein (group 3)/Putative flagellar system-associated repeat protein [Phaeobacter inhibens]